MITDGLRKGSVLPLICPVKRSCLIKGAVDAGDGRDIDQRSVADSLPAVDKNQDKRPVLRRIVPEYFLLPVGCEKRVEHAVLMAQEGKHDIAGDHDGDQKGEQYRGLVELLKALVRHIADHDCQNNADNVIDNDEGDIIQECIADNGERVVRGQKILEIFESVPRAAVNAVVYVIFLKGDNDACHGNIFVDQQIEQAGNHHDVKRNELFILGRGQLFLLFL